MLSPIRSLSSLIQQLTHPLIVDPFLLVANYQGTDWKKIKTNYPVTLFQQSGMELVLTNWKQAQCNTYYGNYHTIQLRVLKGSFDITEACQEDKKDFKLPRSVLYIPNIKKELCIYKKTYTHTFSPISKVLLTAKKPATMLQLNYYNQFYD